MLKQKLYDKVSYGIREDGKIIFNNNEVNVRDETFIYYYLIKTGQAHKVIPFIDNLGKKLNADHYQYNEVVFWLWIIGEYTNETKNNNKIKEFSSLINSCIDYICEEWNKPRDNWLQTFEEEIYISNIAMSYGAIQSINNSIKNARAQKLLVDIQKFLFDKFLDKGKVVSKLGDKEVLGDISIIAIPFALMDAGNQILVQSINFVEKELVTTGVRFSNRDMFYGGCIRSDLTCLLSWYYSEKGDIARAKWLLEQVKKTWDRDGKLYIVDTKTAKEEIYYNLFMQNSAGTVEESFLSYILYAIASNNIYSKEQISDNSVGSINILHSVEGTGNKYLIENTERYPNYPIHNDNVILKMVTQPFNSLQNAYVEYSVNGVAQGKLPMKVQTSDDGEKYWEASIGHFEFNNSVDYRFIVKVDNSEYISKTYRFTVRGWQPIGDITSVYKTNDSIMVYFSPLVNGIKIPCLEIKKHADHTLKWSLNLDSTEGSSRSHREPVDDVKVKLDTTNFQLDICNLFIDLSDDIKGQILQSYNRHGGQFIELLTDNSGTIYKLRYKFLINSQEKYFGMGERYDQIEYTGLNIDNYVFNQYTGQGLRTYMPVPLAISSKGYGIYLDTTMYSIFRFGTRLSDLFEVEIDIHRAKQSLDTYIFIGSPKEVIQSFVEVTGKPKLPPKWAFGLWMSSHNWDSQKETYKQVELAQKYEIPATALVLEQWSDEATFYIFNDAQHEVKDGNDYLAYDDFIFPEWGRWPNPKKMVSDLHKDGIKVLLWQAPVQKFMDGIAHAQRDEDERVMLKNGYHIKYKDGSPYRVPSYEWFKRSLTPDFSNPKAKEWWLNKRRYLVEEIGIDGFKSDGGECIYGEDLLFYDGRTGDEMRNQYPNDYIQSFHEFVNQYASDGGLTFSRAGYTGAQNIPLHWAGDENSTYQAFRASINAGLSCSMSGIPFWGWDIGGFHGEIPTAELYIRGTQMATFCPIMQYHAETKGEFNRDRTPWNIAERTQNPDVIRIFKKYVDLRMNLLPYIYQEAIHSSYTGIPMMRAMCVEYPEDESCSKLVGQYFFGNNLLVAPVTEENSYTKDVYLPEGKWVDFFEGTEIAGNCFITVKAGIDQIPVFIRENSIIPMNLSDNYQLCSYVGNKLNTYNNLSFMIYVSDAVSYTFTDDLGNNIDISLDIESNNLNINVSGDVCQPITFIIKNLGEIHEIVLDDQYIKRVTNLKEIRINTYCIVENDLFIKVDSENTRGTVITNLELD